MEKIEKLEQFILNNPELEKLEDMVSQFNVFEILDIVNAEIRHSNILSWLLNPRGNHSIGDSFIKQFMKYLVSKNKTQLSKDISLFDFETLDYTNIEIRREWNNIDLLIIISNKDKKYVICIENKISTTEHSNQLQKYKNTIEKEFREHSKIYVYLTSENLIPSDDDWISFGYDIVAKLVEDLLESKKNVISEDIYSFISQYKTVLRRYIVGNSEIEEICKKIYQKHREALDIIYQYKPDIVLEISNYCQELIRSKSNLILDRPAKTDTTFISKYLDELVPKLGEGWTQSGRILLFALYITNKVDIRLYIGPGKEELRNKLFDIVDKNPKLFNKSQSKLGSKWLAIYQKVILSKKELNIEDIEDIKPIITDKINEFINEDFKLIEEYFKKNWK